MPNKIITGLDQTPKGPPLWLRFSDDPTNYVWGWKCKHCKEANGRDRIKCRSCDRPIE